MSLMLAIMHRGDHTGSDPLRNDLILDTHVEIRRGKATPTIVRSCINRNVGEPLPCIGQRSYL
jgi:hypothetical protein